MAPPRRWLPVVVAVCLVGLGIVAVGQVIVRRESVACGFYRSRVTARCLDAETRAPLAGVTVVVLWEMSDADDGEWVPSRRRAHEESPDRPFGVATSGDDGLVDLQTTAPFCHHVSQDFLGRVTKESGAPHPGYGVAGIVAEKPGYLRLVVETPRDRWTAVEPRNHDDPAAALDLGDLLLTPE